jgi:hypothetical protein
MRSPRRRKMIGRMNRLGDQLKARSNAGSEVLPRAGSADVQPGSSEYLRTGVGDIKTFADASAAAVMPAHTSLAKLLASHVLGDGEVVLLVLRPSLWFILLSCARFLVVALLGIFAASFFGSRSMWSHGTMRSLVELGVTAISARLMWATLQWMSRLYILTDLRVLILSGVFSVTIFDCPLRKVARTRLIRSNPERATGIGTIEIIPQDDELPFGQWQMIAQPTAVHEQIQATISRAKQGG